MTTPAATTTTVQSLALLLRTLKLPAFNRYAEEIAQKAEREAWTFGRYLHHLAELEVSERRRRRIERCQKQSELPGDKTIATLNRARLPPKVAKQLQPSVREDSSSEATTCWRSVCPDAARHISSAPSATSS
jgi:DNA replication protein DnaC